MFKDVYARFASFDQRLLKQQQQTNVSSTMMEYIIKLQNKHLDQELTMMEKRIKHNEILIDLQLNIIEQMEMNAQMAQDIAPTLAFFKSILSDWYMFAVLLLGLVGICVVRYALGQANTIYLSGICESLQCCYKLLSYR